MRIYIPHIFASMPAWCCSLLGTHAKQPALVTVFCYVDVLNSVAAPEDILRG